MFTNAEQFLAQYGWESEVTSKVLANVTDASLNRQKAEGHNTLGDIAYHIASSPAMMLREIKWNTPERGWVAPAGITAAEIQKIYNDDVAAIKALVATKTADELNEVHHVFGMMDWNAHQMLGALISHEIHHRGQLSVLMRQAGLVVPSIYGPNAEETAVMLEQMNQQQG